ncbi:MAG: PH domain-containing protein [Armatimonadota bacterium]
MDAEVGGVFGYGISRASRVMLGLLVLAVVVILGPSLLLGARWEVYSEEGRLGMALIVLVLAGVLVPVPAMELLWWLRGRVVAGPEGLAWRAWGGWRELEWEEIIAIGYPPSVRRAEDTRLHIVTDSGYEFIYGCELRERDEAVELIAASADLPEQEQVGPYVFRCRAGTSERVAAEAAGHLHLIEDDPWDFWATRFRRY